MSEFEAGMRSAERRLDRAQKRIDELTNAISTWRESSPYSVRFDIGEDRRSWTATLDLTGIPDADELGDTFGDAVHQMRATLDNLMWTVLNGLDVKPAKPRQVYFPMCTTAAAWAKVEKDWASQLPEHVRTQLLTFQPFVVPEELLPTMKIHPLLTLHRYDVMDKHVATGRLENEMNHFAATVDVEFDEADGPRAQHVVRTVTDNDFGDGKTVVRQWFDVEIKSIRGTAELPYELVVRDLDGDYVGLTSSLEQMLVLARLIVERIGAAARLSLEPSADAS